MAEHANWFHEESGSDTRTSYPIYTTLVNTTTRACESVVIADAPTFGKMLFLDGELQSTSADEHIYHETLVHPVMMNAPRGSNVLVIGGGEGATVREILRWNPSHIDWVDIDGELVTLCRDHLKWAPNVYTHPNVTFYAEDIRVMLPKLGKYDVIILDLPDPDKDSGYLYSSEFWVELKQHLIGNIVTHCGPVRPFGNIGDGYQMVSKVASLYWNYSTFYAQAIPSFQNEWGFLIMGDYKLNDGTNAAVPLPAPLPEDLRVVDKQQVVHWLHMQESLLWKRVLHYCSAEH